MKRDPHDVLGVGPNASATQIKAAWRRLARENHPDLIGDDPGLSRSATRRMAEINDAYAALTQADTRRDADTGDDGEGDAPFTGPSPRRGGGPPRPKPTRPVTGRLDTTATYRARDSVAGDPTRKVPLSGQPPLRGERVDREPPRASTPTGPAIRGRLRHFRRPAPPSLDGATGHIIEFGKFHGHTLGQVASFEPSYIDWIAGNVTRDPELAAAARVIQADLDRRGILRRIRPPSERPGRTA